MTVYRYLPKNCVLIRITGSFWKLELGSFLAQRCRCPLCDLSHEHGNHCRHCNLMLFFPFLPHQPPSSFTQPTHLNSKRAWKSFQRTRAIKMRLGSHWLGLKPALPLVTTRPRPESTEGSSNPHQHWHATLNLLPIDSLQRTFCFSILSVKHGAVWSPPPLLDNALYRILNPTGNEQGVKFRRKSNEEVVGGLTARPLLSFFAKCDVTHL